MSTTADSSDDNLQLPRSRILLVDDTPQNLVALEVVLEDMDCDLDSVTSGNAALAKLLKEDYALVLLDVQMPEMDGFEATRRIRQYEQKQGLPAVPIVALTAHILREHKERSLAAGMNAHLPKPVELNVLRDTLVRFTRPDATDSDLFLANDEMPD